jgi:hypothetical protein
MNTHSIGKLALRKRILAILCTSFCASLSAATPTAAPCACNGTVYSVVNLDPEGGAAALLNERGQAAVGSFVFGTNGYFDGERVTPLGSLGGGFTLIKGINNRGVVLAESVDTNGPAGDYYPVTWTSARGMRALPNSLAGQAWAINDRGQVVGGVPAPGISSRAVRWDPNGARVALGPLPFSLSEGRALNGGAFAGGYADHADGTIHATLYNPAGVVTDLGNMGGSGAYAMLVNERGEAAGVFADAGGNERGFFRSPGAAAVPIGSQNGAVRLVAGLNDRGEVVGITETPAGLAAYLWSRGRGLVQLPRASAPESDVFDINNRSESVGRLWRPEGSRAVLWRGLAAPVDLNSRLHRAPPGLVLEAGAAINEAGTILAYSNAGLVMLRPGKQGTDAPVVGPLLGLPDIVSVGREVTAKIGFIDSSARQTHSVSADWTDSCPSPHPQVVEANGSGQASLQHRFCAPGFQNVTVRVTDSGGRSTETQKQVLVNEPGVAALSGRGTLAGAANATSGARGGATRALPLRFALWAPLANAKGAKAAARAGVILTGPFGFRSEQVSTVSREGSQVRLEGTGRYNGRPGYHFVVDGSDGGSARGADRMRVRISHRDAAGAEVVDYDSARQAPMAKAALASRSDGMAAVEGQLVISN